MTQPTPDGLGCQPVAAPGRCGRAFDPRSGVSRPYAFGPGGRRLLKRPEVSALMRRPLVALVATLAAVVLAATATAVTMSVRDDGNANRSHTMMNVGAQSGPVPDSPSDGWMYGWGGGQMMGGSVARHEFSYLTHMVAHHQEAVDTARQLARSERPQMRAFGRDIVATQSAQIDQMKAWLATWYPGRSTEAGYQPMMRDLSGLSGDQLDRTFLQDMMGHHMAAVMMSQQLLARGGADHPQVETLARAIRVEQHDEIFQMRRWLSAWYGADWRRTGNGWHQGWTGMGPGMMW